MNTRIPRWQENPESRPTVRRTVHQNNASMPFYYAQGGSQAQPAPGELGREKRIEDPGLRRGIHAASGICYFENHVCSPGYFLFRDVEPDVVLSGIRLTRGDADMPWLALADSFGSVDDQTRDELFHLAAISVDEQRICCQIDLQLHEFRHRTLHQGSGLPYNFRKVDVAENIAALAGIRQHLTGQIGRVPAGCYYSA